MKNGRLFLLARRAVSSPVVAAVFIISFASLLGGLALCAAQRPDAASFGEAARQALAKGRLDEAEALAKAQPPNDPRAAAVAARVMIMRGQYSEAEKRLTPVAAAAPTSDAALELGLLLQRLGKKTEADRALTGIVDAPPMARRPENLLRAGLAARALGQFQDANAFFRAAAAMAPDDPEVNTAWGDLFLEKYNKPEALKSYQGVLKLDANWAPALLGVARTLVDENPPAARKTAERALEINPYLTEARLLLAELALDEARRDEARQQIGKALAINPSSLEARSLLAATAYLEDRKEDFEAEVARVLAINPTYGEVYRVAGEQAAHNYRFDEAVTLVKRALAIDSNNVHAYADLGIHLLRTGDEPGARAALDRAFKVDPYDVVTYNLLGLFDTLEKFETIQEGEITLRMHAEEAPVLRYYAMPLAQEALRTLSARYGFTPKGPILVEIFPKHDDFAVRNVGLPGMIGALGACFGRVVTMDSPRARPPGTFSWGETLWHEMAHVITLQMSNQRVPRWLTEGLSVFEESRARPEWGRDMEVAFAHAMNTDGVLKLKDLNSGFSRPETISLAYFEASLLVDHIIATYTEPAIHKLLRAYGEGLDTDAAMKKAVGVELEALQDGFSQYLEKKFGAIRRALQAPDAVPGLDKLPVLKQLAAQNAGSYPVQVALGEALAAAGEVDAAMQAFERATTLVPVATGKESARAQLIELALQKGDRARAIRELDTLLIHDHTDVEAARQLADLAEAAGDTKRLRTAYERIVALDPFDGGRHSSLGRMALKSGENDLAIREFAAALATGPVDLAGAHCDLAEAYLVAGRSAEAKKQALAALEQAPAYERAQELLLQVVNGRKL